MAALCTPLTQAWLASDTCSNHYATFCPMQEFLTSDFSKIKLKVRPTPALSIPPVCISQLQ
jgi:hypothetical protein